MFISYAHEDGERARRLAGRLRDNGVRFFLLELSLLPGDLVLLRIEQAIRDSANGVLLLSPAAMGEPRILQEYAALLRASAERGLRLVPVLYGETEIPPFAATRVWMDFRGLDGQAYDDRVAELARVLRGEPPAAAPPEDVRVVPEEILAGARPAPPRPLLQVERPSLVVCYARADTGYGEWLVGLLSREGLPAWSIGNLVWGDDYIWKIRQQLREALAVIVLMSPDAQDSDDVTREILEGHRHNREFFPILLRGERHYLLAGSWYFDARSGVLPGPAELALLRRLYETSLTGAGGGGRPVLPAPAVRPAVPAVRPRAVASLGTLRALLAEGEIQHADLLTTSLLLDAANRQEKGWMRRTDGRHLRGALLTEIDVAWADFSDGRYGFRAQLKLADAGNGRYADFLALSAKYGWRTARSGAVTGRGGAVPRYDEFAGRSEGGPGFFPTLRNPQSERHLNWYDQWTETVLAVHLRLRNWKGKR
ncbi:TIR domain-containing protein [Streptosporangium sp. NPDC051022]|uniref:TIR domain-containing protein n=1 Tax=Streptosporangium sp. NPDC051022 TaxID=3155752 RepID=UPI00342C7B1C